ncbi:MAG: SGNH/GDSL hydrolase family protein [Lachnospiraceae bacterium]|nr:SGNH/GDSL hydrolase family protein [Lachnospiraceae bacterium]
MTNEIYILRNNLIEGKHDGNSFTESYHLSGRISEQAKMMTPKLNLDYVKQLEQVKSFTRLADSINISISAISETADETACFSINISDEKGYRSKWNAIIPLNGETTRILISPETDEADFEALLASFQITFPCYMLAEISVSLNLRESLNIDPPEADKPVDFNSQAYQKMIKASLLHTGNLARLKKAIAKAKLGEEITIAYIGGSITQGAGAKPINNRCYAKLSCEAFKKRFAKDTDKVHFVKAGIGGTPSQLGIARYKRDILAPENQAPDIVIIEFAVNDYSDETNGVCYESLCLMAYEGAGSPAVILLFSVFANDENLEDRLAKVGYHYDFPMVSAKQAVLPEYAKNRFLSENDLSDSVLTRRHYFHDILHPSNTGHQIMADSLDYLWKIADEAEAPKINLQGKLTSDMPDNMPCTNEKLPTTPIIGDRYKNLKLLTRQNIETDEAVKALDCGGFTEYDRVLQSVERNDDLKATPQFTDNWSYRDKTKPGFTMEIKAKDLLLIYKDTDDRNFAPAEIFVDKALVRTLDPLEAGWNHCGTTFILNGEKTETHLIEIVPKTTEAKTNFTILGFGYTD